MTTKGEKENMRKFMDKNTGKTLMVIGETSEHYIGIDLQKSKVGSLAKGANVIEQETTFEINDFPVLKAVVKNLYAVAGQARTGKDTFADKMIDTIHEANPRTHVYRSALANPIKEVQKIMFESGGKNRDELIYIGQTLRINNPVIWLETWLRYAIVEAEYAIKSHKEFVIIVSDVRQKNEIEFFQSLDAFIIKMEVTQSDLQKKQLALEGTSTSVTQSTVTETDLLDFHEPDLLVLHNYDTDFSKEVNSFLSLGAE